MKTKIFPVYIIVVTMLLSCTSTRIVSSWRQPDKQVTINQLHKVLVVALFKTETGRHKAEDQMIRYLKGKGVVSYEYLSADFDKKNEAALHKKISLDGFDGAVTMRLVDTDKETIYRPGSTTYPIYLGNFSNYYYRNYTYYATPGYYSSTTTYTVETNVFSIKENKLIWSGITKTVDPNGVKKMTHEIVGVVYRQMVTEGFISK